MTTTISLTFSPKYLKTISTTYLIMREVVCSFCNHRQKTNSKLKRITCSSCQKKFIINKDGPEKNSPIQKIKSRTKVPLVQLD